MGSAECGGFVGSAARSECWGSRGQRRAGELDPNARLPMVIQCLRLASLNAPLQKEEATLARGGCDVLEQESWFGASSGDSTFSRRCQLVQMNALWRPVCALFAGAPRGLLTAAQCRAPEFFFCRAASRPSFSAARPALPIIRRVETFLNVRVSFPAHAVLALAQRTPHAPEQASLSAVCAHRWPPLFRLVRIYSSNTASSLERETTQPLNRSCHARSCPRQPRREGDQER